MGKGNHSTDHVQKLKPRVEQVCRELGLQYATEENSGRIYGKCLLPWNLARGVDTDMDTQSTCKAARQ